MPRKRAPLDLCRLGKLRADWLLKRLGMLSLSPRRRRRTPRQRSARLLLADTFSQLKLFQDKMADELEADQQFREAFREYYAAATEALCAGVIDSTLVHRWHLAQFQLGQADVLPSKVKGKRVPRPRPPLTPHDLQVTRMRSHGMSLAEIGRKLGMSKQAVAKRLKR